jgi:putative sterol carrier protein
MENCGTISINEFLCESCCTNKSMMKINKKIERLSLENEEFKDELSFFKNTVVQTMIPNSDFKFWVEFGNGAYLFDKGVKDNPIVTLTCPQENMNLILEGKLEPFDEFFSGNLKIEGDLQYAVVFFDILKLASEIIKEIGGV